MKFSLKVCLVSRRLLGLSKAFGILTPSFAFYVDTSLRPWALFMFDNIKYSACIYK